MPVKFVFGLSLAVSAGYASGSALHTVPDLGFFGGTVGYASVTGNPTFHAVHATATENL